MSLFLAPSRKLAAARLEHGGPRIYDPRERAALRVFDATMRIVSPWLGLRPPQTSLTPGAAKRILVLRLDRLGDFLMTLPALEALRRAAPEAHIELAVGSWNEPVARRLSFVDAVRIVDTPWTAWGGRTRSKDARAALRGVAPDLAIDFQGDIRALLLMSTTGAPLRAGYADTGGAYLLTHRAPWDESTSWYRQNLTLVRALFPHAEERLHPVSFVTEEDRQRARPHLRELGDRPLVGIQPSAGRRLKQWEVEKFAALIDRLSDRARVVVTGSSSDRELVERIVARSTVEPPMLLGLDLPTFAAVVERLDVFVSGDTGPMHLSHAVGTPNVAIFGPSDPRRYGPEAALGLRRVVREPVYCSPCNMIRRPPAECRRAAAPDCIAGISLERVLDAVHRELDEPRAAGA